MQWFQVGCRCAPLPSYSQGFLHGQSSGKAANRCPRHNFVTIYDRIRYDISSSLQPLTYPEKLKSLPAQVLYTQAILRRLDSQVLEVAAQLLQLSDEHSDVTLTAGLNLRGLFQP